MHPRCAAHQRATPHTAHPKFNLILWWFRERGFYATAHAPAAAAAHQPRAS
ncbi:hypothetical protein FB451DRAFT_1398713 [Mycena latifolia]|nr:hypothetical protein FB451DRAFT_1398713 [Mycena latifolia]